MRTSTVASGVAALLVGLAAGGVGAESHRSSGEDHPGYSHYRQYCASCHGVLADGKGPVAPALKTPPADLTRLGERYGMPFPRNKLLPFIDGRDARRAHGTREMPVWGRVLNQDLRGRPEREMAVRGTILVILDYLESVQAPATTESE